MQYCLIFWRQSLNSFILWIGGVKHMHTGPFLKCLTQPFFVSCYHSVSCDLLWGTSLKLHVVPLLHKITLATLQFPIYEWKCTRTRTTTSHHKRAPSIAEWYTDFTGCLESQIYCRSRGRSTALLTLPGQSSLAGFFFLSEEKCVQRLDFALCFLLLIYILAQCFSSDSHISTEMNSVHFHRTRDGFSFCLHQRFIPEFWRYALPSR